MSHAVRLHMCQVYVCTEQDMVLCVGQASLRVSCYVVLWLGRCGGLTRKVSSLPQTNYLTQWRSREDGRGGGGLEKRRSCVQPCGVTRASLVRARAARALSEAAESRRAVAHVPSVRVHCTGYGAVRGASVSSSVLLCCFVAGALRRSHTEGQQPPNPKGWTSRSRRTSHLDRPPGRPCRESPGLFVLSLSHSWECNRQWVVNPPARLPWIARRWALLSPQRRASPRLIKRQRC